MDSVIRAYYWAGLIGDLSFTLLFFSFGLFLLLVFSACTACGAEAIQCSQKTATKIAVITSILLVITSTTVAVLPNIETRQIFVNATISAALNDDSLLPLEREMLQELAASLPKQKDGGQQ